MQRWKKALVVGSLGVGAAVALGGRRSTGLALMAGGLALLVSEYPEQFDHLWENAPEYLNRSMQVLGTLGSVRERLAEEAGRFGAVVSAGIERA